jgi:hypothetical protein
MPHQLSLYEPNDPLKFVYFPNAGMVSLVIETAYTCYSKWEDSPVDWAAFLGGISRGKTVLEYGANRTIFVQGDPADSVWYLQHGEVKLAVTSQQGKEAIVSVLGDNEFFGEGCLAGQPLRISTASAVTIALFTGSRRR